MKTIRQSLCTAAWSVLLFSLPLLAVLPARAQETTPEQTAEELIKPWDNEHDPGGVVLVMRGGEIIYQKAFGMANLSHGIPFEAGTRTNIGSTSKQFTAFAIVLLEQRGLLSLDDDIRLHIPELPELAHTVTLRHLVSHTSGYREFLNAFAMAGRQPTDDIRREEIIALVQRQPALQYTPGELFLYNNTGFSLLATVVERVGGRPFHEWMDQEVFRPLGMEQTLVRANRYDVIKNSAQGYAPTEEESFREAPDLASVIGAGGMYTTVGDLALWVNNFFEPRLGGKEAIDKMTTPYVLNGGQGTGYGLGLFLDDLHGLTRWHHGGSDMAHRSQLFIFPDIRGAVITQSNHAGFDGSIAQKLAEAFFADGMESSDGEEQETASGEFVFDPELFDDYAGRYELDAAPGFVLEFTREGDKLYTQASMQPRFEVFPSSDSTFYMTVVEAGMTFHRNELGVVDRMTLHQNGAHGATRVFEPVWSPSPEEVDEYLGRYFSEELEAFYEISSHEDGGILLVHRRMEPIPLKPDEKDQFAGEFPISGINFVRDEQGRVSGFRATSGRSFGILFEKTR
jgi:CubicO group peptidase (beta-lactamase class C family)